MNSNTHFSIRRFLAVTAAGAGLVIACLLIVSSSSQTTNAADAKKFDPGRIIDDVVFYSSSAMSAPQIQAFLDAKVPTCDTDGTQPATDWSDITHATLASYIRNGTNGYTKNTNYHAPPYTCLRDFKQDTPQMEAASGLCGALPARTNRTAAQIIDDVAKACGINPQVLIVLLQKEQSLITDNWPLQRQYRNATGFACPDTAPCDPKFNGFFYQVYHAARQFQVYKAYPMTYNYIAGRTNRIYWNPDLSRCGSSQVFIQNQATAALYIYTPYRPNQAALNNLYGTGDSCSSYGNRNFWRLFTDWFGSTTYQVQGSIGQRYMAVGGVGKLGRVMSGEISLSTGGKYQQFEKGRIYWKSGAGAWEVVGDIGSRYAQHRADEGPLGYPQGTEVTLPNGMKYQQFEGGRIYWKVSDGTKSIYGSIGARYLTMGAHTSRLGYPVGNEVGLSTGGRYQQFEKGRVYWKNETGAWDVGGSIGARYYSELAADKSALSYPVGEEVTLPSGAKFQQFEKGRVYWAAGTGARSVYGAIGTLYETIAYESSRLGLPTSNELASPGGGRYQQFEKGRVYWKNETGAWDVGGSIGAQYTKLGATKSKLGYPTSREQGTIQSSLTQTYKRGKITYKNNSVTVTY